MLHIVSDWAFEEGIALGQVATEEKSNEITVIPELLRQMELKETLITIDAMGCQKEIVTQIIEGKGDSVIAGKKTQPKLEQAIFEHFSEAIESDFEDRKKSITCFIGGIAVDSGHGLQVRYASGYFCREANHGSTSFHGWDCSPDRVGP